MGHTADSIQSHQETMNDSALADRSYVIDGARCEQRDAPHVGCVLDPGQRARLAAEVKERIVKASNQVSMALTQVGFERLVRKEEEPSLLVEVGLSLVTMGLSHIATIALSKVVHGAVERFADASAIARLSGNHDALAITGEKLLSSITHERVSGAVEKVAGRMEKGTSAEAIGRGDEKTASVEFVEQIRAGQDSYFQTLSSRAPAMLDDVELMRLWDAFDVRYHTVAGYKAFFAEKLARFEASGVSAIGRKNAEREVGGPFGATKLGVVRDTRVVWHTYVSGYPRQLMCEFQDGAQVLGIDELHRLANHQRPAEFGPAAPVTEQPELGAAVPEEFIEYALARHRAVWGGEPKTVLVDDSQSYDPMRVAAAMKNKARRATTGDMRSGMAARRMTNNEGAQ